MEEASMAEPYLPRFVLQNYSFERPRDQNGNTSNTNNQAKGNGRGKGKSKGKDKRVSPFQSQPTNDALIRTVDLVKAIITERPVSAGSGLNDLGTAFSDVWQACPTLKPQFLQLEEKAKNTISQIRAALDNGKMQVSLSVKDFSELRRFCFFMLFRNRVFDSCWNNSKETYHETDRAELLQYMDKKHFSEPKEVYLQSIRVFLACDLNKEITDWKGLMKDTVYRPHGLLFFHYIHTSYAALVRPENAEDEFILSQNAGSIFEGVSNDDYIANQHCFAPISPKLLIVFRDVVWDRHYTGFPEVEEARMQQGGKPLKESPLKDLPVTPAMLRRTASGNGSSNRGAKKPPVSSKDSLDLNFHSVSRYYVGLMNSMFLDNASKTSSLIFHTTNALRLALEFYLRLDMTGFKNVAFDNHRYISLNLPSVFGKVSRSYLETLEQVVAQLGSNFKLQNVIFPRDMVLSESSESIVQRRYEHLGGTRETFAFDFDQARRLVNLITLIDPYMAAAPSSSGQAFPKIRDTFLGEFPAKRIWLMVKIFREFSASGLASKLASTRFKFRGSGLKVAGVEDAIADAYHVFTPRKFSFLMSKAYRIDTYYGIMDSDPQIDDLIKLYAFSACGLIAECGIPQVEELAQKISQDLNEPKQPKGDDNWLPQMLSEVMGIAVESVVFFEKELQIDILTRAFMVKTFKNLSLGLDSRTHERLQHALFDVCFPHCYNDLPPKVSFD